MTGYDDLKRDQGVLNVLQVVTLNIVLTVVLCAALRVFGTGLVLALALAWIGGAVLTLWCVVALAERAERREKVEYTNRAAMIAAWKEDALDDAWECLATKADGMLANRSSHSNGTNG